MGDNYKKLRDVMENAYIIRSYQRGYRWDKANVTELLDDIFEGKLIGDYEGKFDSDKYSDVGDILNELKDKIKNSGIKNEYCLQPLVVKKIDEVRNVYSVIDGQQRLTTLYIILKTLCSISSMKFPVNFSIEYDSRGDSKSFLENLSEQSEENGIDSAYMLQAYTTAKSWFVDKIGILKDMIYEDDYNEHEDKNAYVKHMKKVLFDETKFIWDEIDLTSNEISKKEKKIFADRNTGRLELTDSELIKSLFMNPQYYDKSIANLKDRQILISEMWDMFENELHVDEFWEFVPVSDNDKTFYEPLTRIDVIFQLLMEKEKVEIKREDRALFKAVKAWIDNRIRLSTDQTTRKNGDEKQRRNLNDVMTSAWRAVCDVFDGIRELYTNNELYNLLSLYKMIQVDSKIVSETYLETLGSDKSKRADVVKKKIFSELFGNCVEYKVKKVRYPDLDNIRKILYAHNVAVTNTSDPVNRFSFHQFRDIKGNWDVEHIYATNEGYIKKKAPLSVKKKLLEMFSSDNDNTYKRYIEFIYSITDIAEENGRVKLKKGDSIEEIQYDDLLKTAGKKYTEKFDVWRYLRLKKYAKQLLDKYEIYEIISGILREKSQDINIFIRDAEKVFHDDRFDDNGAFIFLSRGRENFLFWDNDIENEYNAKMDIIGQDKPKEIKWHGVDVQISDPDAFWTRDEQRKESAVRNFIQGYLRDFLDLIYDNSGIQKQNVTLTVHGKKRQEIVNEENAEKVAAFFRGTVERIKEIIDGFFAGGDHINPGDYNIGQPRDYDSFADFINDNSMGNMMLLPADINRNSYYRAENFSGKRKYVIDKCKGFLPVATLNVLIGKYIDLSTSTEQWLMGERKAYMNDMIDTLSDYYGENGDKGTDADGE